MGFQGSKKNLLGSIAVVSLLLGMSACSTATNPNKETEELYDELIKDAGTDAVPEASAETPETDAPVETAATSEDSKTELSDVPPAPVVADVPPAPDAPIASNGGETTDYTVRQGDTLMKIAYEQYGDLYQWKALYEANRDRISNPNNLAKGTVLKIEKSSGRGIASVDQSGEKYMIQKGDTLGTISTEIYGTPKKWKKLYEQNKGLIKDPNQIFAGFYLYYTATDEEKQQAALHKQESVASASASAKPFAVAPVKSAAPFAPTTAPAQQRVPASVAPVAPVAPAAPQAVAPVAPAAVPPPPTVVEPSASTQ